MKNLILFFLLVSIITETYGKNQIFSETRIEKSTYTFKNVGANEIKADLYRMHHANSSLPVIIWIHGGALIWGSRNDLLEEQLNFYLNEGYALISIDYRLAPETKLNEIVNDVADAVKWVVKNGEHQLGIDSERIYVIGHSAGGYLALMCGILLDTPPKGIVSFYGYGDILADWYTKPDPYYSTRDEVTKEEAVSRLGDSIITSASGPERFNFYLYCRQNGKWPKMISGHEPSENSEYLRRFCPIYNIDSNYPPTLLIHGDNDTDVPVSQSIEFSHALASHSVPFELIEMKGFGHAFDTNEGGLKNEEIKKVFNKVIDFLKQSGI